MAYKVRIPAGPARPPFQRTLAGANSLNLAALFLVSMTVLATFFIPSLYIGAAMAAIVACAAVMYLVASTLHGRVDGVLLLWLLVSPLGYYFLSFPAQKPIFTFDRFVVLVLAGAIVFVNQDSATPVPSDLKRAAVVWCLFILFAFTSMVGLWDEVGLGGTRVIIDAFIFPALLALFVIRVFPVERHIRTIHTMLAVMAIYCAAIGLVEFLTNTDLLALPDDTFYGAEQTGSFPRVNGPFTTNHCFGTIGAIVLLLLFFLRFLMKNRVSTGRLWLHRAGLAAALMMILLPQFRSLLIGLVLVTFLELVQNRTAKARLYTGAVILLLGIAMVSLPVLLPNFFESRIADPSNFYGRVAQQQQTWELFSTHPLNGVGFWNFIESSETLANVTFRDVDSLNSAHNSLGSILAETGVAGCLPFVAANLLLFMAFLKLRKSDLPIARAAWKFFLYIFICYWVMGITLTAAYEHDLNLWYMFACALMYKLALVERKYPRLSEYL